MPAEQKLHQSVGVDAPDQRLSLAGIGVVDVDEPSVADHVVLDALQRPPASLLLELIGERLFGILPGGGKLGVSLAPFVRRPAVHAHMLRCGCHVAGHAIGGNERGLERRSGVGAGSIGHHASRS